MNNKAIVLLLAGGTGTRLGADIPKQYIKVNDRMIIDYCMESVLKCDMIEGLWIVADEMWREEIKASCVDEGRLLGFSAPGTSRAGSIENGIRDIWDYLAKEGKAESTELLERIVIIHDAARPLASVDLLSRLISACDEHDGAMPVLPMKDTIYFGCSDGEHIEKLLDRDRLFAGQAPEAFRLGAYRDAILALTPEQTEKLRGTTEPAIMAGLDVVMIPGEENNFKITTPADLDRFKAMIGE